jgi:hypothetical protein
MDGSVERCCSGVKLKKAKSLDQSIEGCRKTSSNGSRKFEGSSVSIEELCG